MVHSVAGSVAPIYTKNPSFMTLDLDAETLLPINKHSHYFNLTQANEEGTPTWQNHDYLQTFNLTDLSPSSMMNLALRVKNDKDFAQMWDWYMSRMASEPSILDDEKQISEFCQLVSSEDHERYECNKSNGQTVGSAYGSEHNFFSGLGVIDRIIKTWIKTGK